MRKYTYILILFSALLFSSCQKEEIRTPFWEILKGKWKLDKQYTVNGESFDFPDYDLDGTYLVFKSPNKNHYISGGDLKNRYFGMPTIENKQGLYVQEKFFISTLAKIFNPKLSSFYSGAEILKRKGYSTRTFISFPIPFDAVIKESYKKYDQSGYRIENRDLFTKGCQLEMIEYFNIFRDGKWLRGTFTIELISSTSIKFTVKSPYYRRVINGKTKFDEIIFYSTRVPEENVINVPPFELSSYNISNHLRFDDKSTLVYLNKGGAYVSGGVDNNCLSISKGEYVQLSSKIKPFKPMTLSMWIKPKSLEKQKQIIYSKYANKYGPFIFSLEKNKFSIEVNDGNGILQKVVSQASLKSNEWNHIALSVSSNNDGVLYINGVPDIQGKLNSLDVDASSKVILGSSEFALKNGIDNSFNGYLDEFVFFEKNLSRSEIAQLYLWHLSN